MPGKGRIGIALLFIDIGLDLLDVAVGEKLIAVALTAVGLHKNKIPVVIGQGKLHGDALLNRRGCIRGLGAAEIQIVLGSIFRHKPDMLTQLAAGIIEGANNDLIIFPGSLCSQYQIEQMAGIHRRRTAQSQKFQNRSHVFSSLKCGFTQVS